MKAYTDEELELLFIEVSKGYPVDQAVVNVGCGLERLERTFDDLEVRTHVVYLSCVAGALIRAGKLPVPNRWDSLFDKYRGLYENNSI